jgi:hypothetical protein
MSYHVAVNSALNVLEAEELLRLCRAGRLYDVEKWIAAGRSLAMPTGTRNTPLGIAINNGFHSLAELLARRESQEQKDHALRHAVRESGGSTSSFYLTTVPI